MARASAKAGEWVASWRLTRRQLETVARGELPAIWRTWALRDLRLFDDVDPASHIVRTSRRRDIREKR